MTEIPTNEERIEDGGVPLDRVFRVNGSTTLFDTEADVSPGSIRVMWSKTGNTDRTQWNPLDFIIVPTDMVVATVLNLLAQFEGDTT